MSEVLSSIAGLCAEAMAYPDADVEYLASLQAQVIQKLRESDPAIPGEQPQQPGLMTGMSAGGPVPTFASTAPSPGAGGLPVGLPGGGGIGPMGATSELSRLP